MAVAPKMGECYAGDLIFTEQFAFFSGRDSKEGVDQVVWTNLTLFLINEAVNVWTGSYSREKRKQHRRHSCSLERACVTELISKCT